MAAHGVRRRGRGRPRRHRLVDRGLRAARLDVDPATAAAATAGGGAANPRDGLLDRVTDALHAAHEQIGRLVDADPAINGTSTTATVALFDGRRVGIGHVGDSRAYLFRDNEISQLTTDHTFVQSLIDEGRITEAEARVHPHRNLILKALDGVHEAEPDLFVLELVAGDRLFLCSDGACGVLEDGRLADILSMGTPDFAAVELVRASLEAGSSDNVTCIVADVVDAETAASRPGVRRARADARRRGRRAQAQAAARAVPRPPLRRHRRARADRRRDPRRPALRRRLRPARPARPRGRPLRPAAAAALRLAAPGDGPGDRGRRALDRRRRGLVLRPAPVLRRRAGRRRGHPPRRRRLAARPRPVRGRRGDHPRRSTTSRSSTATWSREGIPVDDLAEARDRVEELSAKRIPADDGRAEPWR